MLFKHYKIIKMKILTSLFPFLLVASSFAQNTNWVNAPINPVPYRANLIHQHLKADVFQYAFKRFSRDGKWILYQESAESKEGVQLDTKGRVIQETLFTGSITNHAYDSKGNLVLSQTNYDKRVFSYDDKNRLIKEVYTTSKNETRTRQYSYKQQNGLLIVTELETGFNNKLNETEMHFKNGLEVYTKEKGYSNTIIEYEFDHKGNWIKQTKIDVETKKIRNEPYTREIIYYDEYDKGINAISVVAKKLVKESPLLVPKLYINNKKYNTSFNRFIDDYVFYDGLSKTYYVARGGYSKNNIEGQKLPVEKLLSGHENVLLYDGKYLSVLEKGTKPNKNAKWKFEQWYGSYLATDTISGKTYVFAKSSVQPNQKTVALIGKNMSDPDNNLWYFSAKAENKVAFFENGKMIDDIQPFGMIQSTGEPIVAVNGVPKYVLSEYRTHIDKTFAKARYFEPGKDQLNKPAASPEKKVETNQSSTATVPSNTNNNTDNSSLSTNSKNYLNVYRGNPQNVKKYLDELYNTWLQKKYFYDLVTETTANMANEVYLVDKDAAFEILMKMHKNIKPLDVLSKLNTEAKAYVMKKARANIQKYSDATY